VVVQKAAADAKRVADEKAAADAKLVAEQKAAADAKRVADEKAAADAKRVADQKPALVVEPPSALCAAQGTVDTISDPDYCNYFKRHRLPLACGERAQREVLAAREEAEAVAHELAVLELVEPRGEVQRDEALARVHALIKIYKVIAVVDIEADTEI
jgi:hypothetical protein